MKIAATHGAKSVLLAATLMFIAAAGVGRSQEQADPSRDESLRKFLQAYVGTPVSDAQKGTRYSVAFTDLRDDGALEAIVYLRDGGWCGSGGCTALILIPKDSTYEVVAKITVSRLPIRVLSTKTSGWHEISVLVAGGGIPGFEARLGFDGKTYPTNPTMPHARRTQSKISGRVVISETDEGKPLF